jgi:hypothetical protein
MDTEADYPFEFSAHELDILRTIAKEYPAISIPLINEDFGKIHLTRPLARILGDRLTFQLAKVGFDEKYDLTEEGKLIESLIDKLFIL